MALYKYRAKKGPHEIVEGTIEARSEAEAVEKISAQGYLPVRIEGTGPAVQPKEEPPKPKQKRRIKGRQITVFTRQLASLLKSGVPILTSLNIIAEQSENAALKNVIHVIHDRVKDGATFSFSLSQYPYYFSALYVAMVRSGETSGALPEVLFRITDYRSRQEEMLSRLRMALAYPILMAIVGIATIIFMLTFVMPRLMNIFTTLGQNLPLATRMVISTSHFLRQWWVWLAVGAVIAVVRWQLKTAVARRFVSRITLRLPLLGNLAVRIELSRFSRTMELLIKSGIPILKAIEIAVPVVGNEVLREKLLESYKELEQGGSLGKSLKSAKVFPVFMSNLIIVGEESGKLSDALSEVANAYERDTEETIKIMTNLLEPLMILVMGLIVGFIVIAMLLPIFEINVMSR